ncbi:MAG TPA: hypothetical protein VJ044_04285 [Candidatus Hodarchaeales archaeon]|nr:hypothetical protein [Candidatus Hodarchaeales archaeon]
MKKELPRTQDDLFFVAGQNVAIQWKEPYKIRKDMIETRNFVPQAFLITSLLNEKGNVAKDEKHLTLCEGEISMADKLSSEFIGSMKMDSSFFQTTARYMLDEENDGDEEDWDEEDEDWDDEDEEEWDEDEEDWDEDEDWDEEDDEEEEDGDEDEEEEK